MQSIQGSHMFNRYFDHNGPRPATIKRNTAVGTDHAEAEICPHYLTASMCQKLSAGSSDGSLIPGYIGVMGFPGGFHSHGGTSKMMVCKGKSYLNE